MLCVLSECNGPNVRVVQRVGIPLFNALIDYDSDKFEAVVDHLLPVKYDITDGLFNGSRAQVTNCISFLLRMSCLYLHYHK